MASSQWWMIQKMLPNEELLIVLRRQINCDKDHKEASIDCLATSATHGWPARQASRAALLETPKATAVH
jgi:hypothetical protein